MKLPQRAEAVGALEPPQRDEAETAGAAPQRAKSSVASLRQIGNKSQKRTSRGRATAFAALHYGPSRATASRGAAEIYFPTTMADTGSPNASASALALSTPDATSRTS
jgi:hypothetical protein